MNFLYGSMVFRFMKSLETRCLDVTNHACMFICLSVNSPLLGMSKSAELALGQGKQSECGDEYYEEIEEKNFEKEKKLY